MKDLEGARRTTLHGILTGYGVGLAVYAGAYLAWPAAAWPASAVEDPLRLALWLGALPAVFVLAVYYSCLRLRDVPEAVNPLGGGESERWKINQRVLTNSVEQLAIFLPLLVALSTRVDAAHAKLLPLDVGGWVVARIAFWWGYRVAPVRRAPGMAATNLMAIVTLAWLVRMSV